MSVRDRSAAMFGVVRRRLTFTGSKSGAYVLVSRVFAQLSQFVIFIFAARVLSPAAFGVFAVTSAMAILLARIGDAGWREFIMSSRSERANEQAATAALLCGGASGLVCLGLAAGAHALFDRREMAGLLVLFGLWLPIASATSVQAGMLVRRGRLAALAFVQIAAETVGLAATVLLLLQGYGVFALVYGRLAYQIVHLAGVLHATRWFPPLGLDRATVAELVGFSRHILANRLIAFFRSYAATLSIGFCLGPASAGYFRAAERIVLALSEVLAETFQMIGWMSFRRSAEGTAEGPAGDAARRERLSREASFLHPLLLATAAPVFVGIATVADNLVDAALGPEWAPAGLVLSVIAIRQLVISPTFLTEPLLATSGQMRRVPPVSAMNAVVAIAMVVCAAPFGIVAVAAGQLFAAMIAVSTAFWLQTRHGGLVLREVVSRSAFILPATLLLVIAALAADRFGLASGLSTATRLALQVGAGGTAYLAAAFVLQKLVGGRLRVLARPQGTAYA